MRKLDVKHLSCFTCGNKHSQLFALFWNVVGREPESKGFELSGVVSSICMISLCSSCSDMLYILTENFGSEWMA